ncbi:hypothetical protein FQR65_LT09936 [Abscondita terminalis]|nr:hypothetical protein FQR65_LT09936 [Abscondita terminalis]
MFQRTLTEELQKQAFEELNETTDKREEVLNHIIEWIRKEPDIKFRIDRLWLLNFIRGAKFSTQRTKQKIEAYLIAKVVVPELFVNPDPLRPVLQQLMMRGFAFTFPTSDKDCMLLRFGALDPNDNLFDVTRIPIMIFEVLLNESEAIIISGNYVIVDMKNFPFKFLKQITATNLKRLFEHSFFAYPNRIKLIAFINCNTATESIFNIAKPFLPTKILNRVTFYGENYSELYKTIPQKYFPKEYGGIYHSTSDLIEFWKRKLESYKGWFMENENYSFDLDKKRLILDDANNTYGADGSFRKLEID